MLRDFEYNYFGIDEKMNNRNYCDGQLTFVRNSLPMIRRVPRGVPLRAGEYRINLIWEGNVVYKMNLIDYPLGPGDVLITPPNTIGLFESFDETLVTEVIALPVYLAEKASAYHGVLPSDVVKLHLDDTDVERVKILLDLLEHYVKLDLRHPRADKRCGACVNHLLLTLTYDLISLSGDEAHRKAHDMKSSERFNQFLRYVNKYGMQERNLRFYADKMNLSTTLLSSLILEQSGKPASYWIVQTTVMEAKMLLCHTNIRIFEIAARLGFSEASAFIRFFRTHTGMSPGAYREENR